MDFMEYGFLLTDFGNLLLLMTIFQFTKKSLYIQEIMKINFG